MKHAYLFVLALIISASFNCYAQTLPTLPVNLQSTYTKGTRTSNGAPGKNYWQNSADYTIKISFDPKSRILSGTVGINYINSSPDTLNQIEFKLYPNLFKKGSMRNMPVLPEDESDGVEIQQLSFNGKEQDIKQLKFDGTNMSVNIPTLHSKQKIHFDITYAYTLNKTSHIRTGQVDTGAFFIA